MDMAKIIVGIILLSSIISMLASSGLRNKYSFSLLAIMAESLCVGGVMLINGNYWGCIPILLGCSLMSGFRIIQGSNPRKIGILTFLGKRVENTKVEGLTLIFEPIIGLVEFENQLRDLDFEIKNVRSCDGVRLEGGTSLTIRIDTNNIGQFDDAGGFDGIYKILDDNIPSWLQAIANERNASGATFRNWEWFEMNRNELRQILRAVLEGEYEPMKDDENKYLNAKNLGFIIEKCDTNLSPKDKKIIEADEDSQVEKLQRKAEEEETATINQQTLIRYQLYKDNAKPGEQIPTLKECRDEVMFERLSKDKKVTITQGGRIVNLGSVGNTDKGGK
jgi:hypothetical protein